MPIYSDLNQFSPTKQNLLVDLDSIFQSITNILSTRLNTRLFLPEFGSELENLLFEPMDNLTASLIYDLVIIAIRKWEPRVVLDFGKSSVIPNFDEYKYDVVLTFKVLGLDDQTYYNFAGSLQKNRI